MMVRRVCLCECVGEVWGVCEMVQTCGGGGKVTARVHVSEMSHIVLNTV